MSPEEPDKLSESFAVAPTAHAGRGSDQSSTLSAGNLDETDDGFVLSSVPPDLPEGKYTLREKLGEGGFGSVWSAIQLQPIRRDVAVKVLKAGMDSGEIVARFAQEKQALAVMDHPGIARVYDAGMTASHRPYFVMELVQGETLNRFCDAEKLSISARLGLFVQVCEAIHHAHRKGIIHRDLKPSNILVCQSESGSQIKVIDFGIAKATTPVSDVSMQTQVGQFMGTPAYMSPEQADGMVDDIDVRTDIYSLGVILYELLTGVRPFDYQPGQRVSVDEVRRRIREETPARPSTRVRHLRPEEMVEQAVRRATDARNVQAILRGDLDWITMKTLEKDRSRRYDSANDLAMDIQRHLNREPVLACPPSRWYVISRFVARHRLAVGMAAAMIVTLLSATVVSTVLYFEEQRARTEADRETTRSRQVVKILSDMISAAGPSVSQGRDPQLMKDLLAATTERIDTELQNQPEIELDMRRLLARAYQDIGEFPLSLKLYQRVVELEERLHAGDKTKLANAYADLSEAMEAVDRLEDAESALRRSIEIRESMDPVPIQEIARDRELLAWLLSRRGDFTASEVEVRKALNEYPDGAEGALKFRFQALMTLGLTLLKTAQFTESEAVHRESLAIVRSMYDRPHPETVTAINNLCHILVEVGKFDEVQTLAEEGLKIEEALSGQPIGTCTDALNKALSSCHAHRGEYEKAMQCLKLSIQAATEVYGPDHRFTNDKRSLLAQVQLQAGLIDDAAKTLQEADELGGDGESADNSLAIAAGKLAFARGELERAEQIAVAEYERTKAESKTPSIGQIEAILLRADICLRRQEPERAHELLNEATQILKPGQNTGSVLLEQVNQRLRQSTSESPTVK
ncbi:MAG: protein kinase [Planctomyces sp.]|nr:protein kinase [Planctomyces sp.]